MPLEGAQAGASRQVCATSSCFRPAGVAGVPPARTVEVHAPEIGKTRTESQETAGRNAKV
jgi:hypothetical protein